MNDHRLNLISFKGALLLVALLPYSTFSQLCTVCDNIADNEMEAVGLTCESADPSFLADSCKSAEWIENEFCRQACFDHGSGYESMLDCCPGCVVCDNVAPSWFKTEGGYTCDIPPEYVPEDLFWTTNCNTKPGWVQNQYCKQSCFDWGVGYEGINCCPKCTICEDEPTPWMVENDMTCASAPKSMLNANCNKSVYWTEYKFCHQTCFDWGAGYLGVKCCPGCSACDNRPSPWMDEVEYTCENAPTYLFKNNCKGKDYWVRNKFCQKACSDNGVGYDGVSCCQECTVCDNRRAPYIENPKGQAYRCTAISASFPESRPDYAQCNTNTSWIENNWCRQSCFDEQKGYEGITCCSDELIR